jgi:signal peptidase I
MRIFHSRLLIQSFKIIFLGLFTIGLLIGCNQQSSSSTPTNSETPTSTSISIGLPPGPEIVGRYRFQGSSMEPNFHDGQYFFVDELAYLSSLPRRGDVVLFRSPTPNNDVTYVKRVVGLPGEAIEIRNHAIYINGVQLNEPYTVSQLSYSFGLEPIPANRYFVLGDNRNNSSDSRNYGPIDGNSILGRVTFIYAPLNQEQIIPRYIFTNTSP